MHPPDRQAAIQAMEQFLRALGRDPTQDPSLRETPQRVTDTYLEELCAGYAVDIPSLIATHGQSGESGPVILRELHVATLCPHHLLPALGQATVAFQPRGKLLGIGGIAQLVEAYSQRLSLQEEIGEQVVSALVQHLGVQWAACRLVLQHTCMSVRGERHPEARLETLATQGVTEVDTDEAKRWMRGRL